MAISAVHFQLLRQFARTAWLPPQSRILEIGEANHYGDWNPDILEEDIGRVADFGHRQGLLAELSMLRERTHAGEKGMQFEVCKLIYRVLFNAVRVLSIDKHGTDKSEPLDLNTAEHEDMLGKFDLSYNHGTAEHIFNIANVFRLMHDATTQGGYMIHESPFTGWVDHGFYTLQPTLFYDLAAANRYEIVLAAIEQIHPVKIWPLDGRERIGELAMMGDLPRNGMLYIAFRKTQPAEFKIPMQGVYAGTVSKEVVSAWQSLR